MTQTNQPHTQQRRYAVIGVGIMGSAIATRLLACGHAVAVFDRDSGKVDQMVAKGAVAVESAAAAAAASEFIITSLNSAEIVRAAVFSRQGVVDGADASKLLIDMSSIDPPSTRAMANELFEMNEMGWVDAPLSGGAPGALEGRLTVMAGGAAEDVERARDALSCLCANFTHMGRVGAGQTTKLVNQLLCAIAFQAVAEAVRMAEAGGVNGGLLRVALAGGRADSRILQEFSAKMAARDYTPTGRIDNMLKDLEAVQAFTQGQRLPLPLTALVSELHRSFVAAGIGAEDSAAMMRQFDGYRGG